MEEIQHGDLTRAAEFWQMIHGREECHNADAADRVEECHNVDEANALTGEDGWFKVSPYGEFPGKIPGRMQKFGKAHHRSMGMRVEVKRIALSPPGKRAEIRREFLVARLAGLIRLLFGLAGAAVRCLIRFFVGVVAVVVMHGAITMTDNPATFHNPNSP